jgi:catechol 2,3-dioxygenase-like lactoylglutathione lyase family enzyme
MERRAMKKDLARKDFIGRVANGNACAQKTGSLAGFDHVALPMQNVHAMLAFYRGLGLRINEGENAWSVYIGDQMIKFHWPTFWQDPSFALRASAAKPPCGDLCFVWDGTRAVENDARPSGRHGI